ncbi:MAG: exodeoxyribonuclease VII large subunit [Acidimicrobiia bacterium]|nr:exodeoxyribonuclease VII large subunit [Acidimicrobiia bacterium]
MSASFGLPFDEPGAGPKPSTRRIHTVSELTTNVRLLLEESFGEVWVEGEISNCRLWNTGHLYFTLKDGQAQIRSVMFRLAYGRLRFKPQDGLRVVARGRVSVYEPKGEYQLVCEHLEPEGLGALQLAFDQLKQRLAAEGLFDTDRKRKLPDLPRKVGVVTSLDGAAVRDVVKVLRRRHPNVQIVIRPTRVQGEGAGLEIARAIRALGRVRGVDVVIVARGGGSIEDLWAFNEEIVARALAGCPVPTISGVGHETDVTIADFVADVRAPTPSAAAEMAVARQDEFRHRIDRLDERLAAALQSHLRRAESRLRSLEARPGFAGFLARLAVRDRHTTELHHALGTAWRAHRTGLDTRLRLLERRLDQFEPQRRLGAARARLMTIDARLAAAWTARQHAATSRLGSLTARLDSLSPLSVLARGYAVCWNADRSAVVSDAATLGRGDRVRVTLARGELQCDVVDARLPPEKGATSR